MPPEIILATDCMFPKTPLPDRCFAAFPFCIGHPFVTAKQGFCLFGKSRLNHAPAFGIITVVFRKSPYTMDMFRQQYPSANGEWTLLPHLKKHGLQNLSALRRHQNFSPFVGNNRKKIGYTRYPYPSIIWHIHPFPIRTVLCRAGAARQNDLRFVGKQCIPLVFSHVLFRWAVPTLHTTQLSHAKPQRAQRKA